MIRIYNRDFSKAFSIFFIILWTKTVTKLFLKCFIEKSCSKTVPILLKCKTNNSFTKKLSLFNVNSQKSIL